MESRGTVRRGVGHRVVVEVKVGVRVEMEIGVGVGCKRQASNGGWGWLALRWNAYEGRGVDSVGGGS